MLVPGRQAGSPSQGLQGPSLAGVPAGLFRLLPHLPSCARTAPSFPSHPLNLTLLGTFTLPFPWGRTFFLSSPHPPDFAGALHPFTVPIPFVGEAFLATFSKLALTSCPLFTSIIVFQTPIPYPFNSYLRSSHLIYRQKFCLLLGVWKGVPRNKQQVRKQRTT